MHSIHACALLACVFRIRRPVLADCPVHAIATDEGFRRALMPISDATTSTERRAPRTADEAAVARAQPFVSTLLRIHRAFGRSISVGTAGGSAVCARDRQQQRSARGVARALQLGRAVEPRHSAETSPLLHNVRLRGDEARTRTCHLPPRANALPADPIRERQSPMQPSPASDALTVTQPSLYMYADIIASVCAALSSPRPRLCRSLLSVRRAPEAAVCTGGPPMCVSRPAAAVSWIPHRRAT